MACCSLAASDQGGSRRHTPRSTLTFLFEMAHGMDLKSLQVAPLEATLQQVARVLNHSSFSRSQGPARLLMYLAEQLSANGGCPANQAELARVLGLPQDFDPTRNPLVRMHMSKLRRKLETYRRGDGQDDAVAITIPRNSYRLQGYVTGAAVLEPAEEPAANGGSLTVAGLERTLVLVSEFACDDAETGNASCTRWIAFWLLAELVEMRWIAAVGPILRERINGEAEAIDSLARRYHVPFALAGSFSRGERGVQISVQLINAATGSCCWADWFDDPTDLSRDSLDYAARRLASRVADRLRQCPMATAAERPVMTASVVPHLEHEPDRQLDPRAFHGRPAGG